MSVAYIALGSNLDDPAQQILRAQQSLARLPQSHLLIASSLYRSEPLGTPDAQPDYCNSVAALRTSLSPFELLTALHAIETELGRRPKTRNAARLIDLDLLLYDELCINTEQLTLPHPRMHERRFVLQPLVEIAPQLILPGGRSAVQLLHDLPEQRIERIASAAVF